MTRNVARHPGAARAFGARRAYAMLVLAALVVLPLCVSGGARAANESLVTAQADLQDMEFSQSRGMITWVDQYGSLWVAGIDPATGLFVPANGKGTLVDADAMALVDMHTIGNGPEWITTATGDQLVYTKFLPGKPHTRAYARLAMAEEITSGVWSSRYLSATLPRNAPYASHDPGDPAPRISYVDPAGNHYWRNVYDAGSEVLVSGYAQSYRSMRFVAGARLAVFSSPVDGYAQVFRYDLDAGTFEQLTFDAVDKDLHSVPWMWRAPEFGGDYVFFTIVADTELRIYRQAADGTWSQIQTIRAPQGGALNSPEPFTHNGRSYVVFAAALPPLSYPAAVYLASVDPATPAIRQLTPSMPVRMRRDPEVFVTNAGPYVYFNRLTRTTDPGSFCVPCSDGVFRSDTGLGPVR
jgi:hypothetical protein